MIRAVLDMHNIITPMMSFTVCNNTHSPDIVSGSDHGDITNIKLDESCDFVGLEIKTDSVVHFDGGVGIADRAGVVGYKVRNPCFSKLHALDFTKLVFALFGGDAVNSETAFDIVHQTEVFIGFLNGDNIYY